MKFKINMHILYHLNWRLFCFKVQLAVHSILNFRNSNSNSVAIAQ